MSEAGNSITGDKRQNVFADSIFRRVSTSQNGVNIDQTQLKYTGPVDSSVATKFKKVRAIGLNRINQNFL